MNCVQLVGSLLTDPALGTDPFGQAVCKLRLAVPTGKPARNVKVDVKVLGAEAGACDANLTRGRWVALSGSLRFIEWLGKDGVIRSRLYVQTRHVSFLGSPRSASEDEAEDQWLGARDDEEDLAAKVASYPVQSVSVNGANHATAAEPSDDATPAPTAAAPSPAQTDVPAGAAEPATDTPDLDVDDESEFDDIVEPDWGAEDYEIDDAEEEPAASEPEPGTTERDRETEVDHVAGD